MRALAAILLLAVIAVSGCTQAIGPIPGEGPEAQYIQQCVQACRQAAAAGRDLSAGPCLIDPIPQNTDWVCDVAHEPRTAADDLPENQCASYRSGAAKRFIEVSPERALIRSGP